MENNIEKQSENTTKTFKEKYGIWMMLVGLIAIIYALKFILEFIEK